MHVQKRVVSRDTGDDSLQKSAVLLQSTTDRHWRRFMNERAIDRAYVPTAHGNLSFLGNNYLHSFVLQKHAANCLTHGCVIVPSFIAAQRLMSHAKTPAQYWSSIIYGNALLFLFSFSTVFHCSCFHPTYRCE